MCDVFIEDFGQETPEHLLLKKKRRELEKKSGDTKMSGGKLRNQGSESGKAFCSSAWFSLNF